MKQLLTILCLVLLSSYSYSQEVIPDFETVTREGLVYHKSPTEPFTGTVETFYRKGKGKLHHRENYKDGKREGLWEEFYRNGQLNRRGNYKNGEREGLWESFDWNGKLKGERNYKDGNFRGCYKKGKKVSCFN